LARAVAGESFLNGQGEARIEIRSTLFATERGLLEKQLKRLRKIIDDAGVLWISWPKKSSGVATDITEDVIRDVCLPLGFVDVKVCAVDETWSGLKLMIRRENRK